MERELEVVWVNEHESAESTQENIVENEDEDNETINSIDSSDPFLLMLQKKMWAAMLAKSLKEIPSAKEEEKGALSLVSLIAMMKLFNDSNGDSKEVADHTLSVMHLV